MKGDILLDICTRREFLSPKVLYSLFSGRQDSEPSPEIKRKESLEAYFNSPMTSYPLINEMPWDMLVAEANKLGIATENRTKNDIARDIFLTSEG